MKSNAARSSTANHGRTPPDLADRCEQIAPFFAMELAKSANKLIGDGQDIILMNIGEPDFGATPAVQAALTQAVAQGKTQYTEAVGLSVLRQRIADWYKTDFELDVDPRRIIVTAGASGALMLACAALVNPGDAVLMPDPCYPCNRQFVAAFGGKPLLVQTSTEQAFQLDARTVVSNWSEATRGVLLASPSNPTGTSIADDTLAEIIEQVRARSGFIIVDEIYQGLSYDRSQAFSALRLGDDIVSVNSFSKYFHMTGWRLGWLVVPDSWVGAFERLAQNLYICPSTLAQHAAIACFEPESLQIYRARKEIFRQRRDLIVPRLEAMGLAVPAKPDGAFYVFADCSRYSDDSSAFAEAMLQEAGVAATPGKDFSAAFPERFLRLSYATETQRIEQALTRLERWLRSLTPRHG